MYDTTQSFYVNIEEKKEKNNIMENDTSKKAVVFDMDETLGSFGELIQLWKFLEKMMKHGSLILNQDFFNELLDLYPEFLRHGIMTIFEYLLYKKQTGECDKIIIYTNNIYSPEFPNRIQKYFDYRFHLNQCEKFQSNKESHSKTSFPTNNVKHELQKHNSFKEQTNHIFSNKRKNVNCLIDKTICAYKINNVLIETMRTTHKKTFEDFMRCSLLSPEYDICFIDNTFYHKMMNEQVYYIHTKSYYHSLSKTEIWNRFLKSNLYLKNKKYFIVDLEMLDIQFAENTHFEKKQLNFDVMVSKNMMFHIENFFEKKWKNSCQIYHLDNTSCFSYMKRTIRKKTMKNKTMKCVFQGLFEIHYECLGYIIEYVINRSVNNGENDTFAIYVKNDKCNVFSNWKNFYNELFALNSSHWKTIDKFENDHNDVVFMVTDDDFNFDNKWIQSHNIICINHSNLRKLFEPSENLINVKIRYSNYKKQNEETWSFPFFNAFSMNEKKYIQKQKKGKINVVCVGSHNQPHPLQTQMLFTNNNDIQFTIVNRVLKHDYNGIKNVCYYENLNTPYFFEIFKNADYVLCFDYNDDQRVEAISASLIMAFSFGAKLIIPKSWQENYNFSSVISFCYEDFPFELKPLNDEDIKMIYEEKNYFIEKRNQLFDMIVNKFAKKTKT